MDGEIGPERIAQYDRLIRSIAGVERKGAKMPYTSVNGHMFSFLSPEGALALRLPRPEREAFLERHRASLHRAHGTVMPEYVTVPDELFATTEHLAPLFRASYEYVAGVRPKPTTRRPGRG